MYIEFSSSETFTLITLGASRCELMLTLCTDVGTPNFGRPFTYIEILNIGLKTFQRFGALNKLHLLACMPLIK